MLDVYKRQHQATPYGSMEAGGKYAITVVSLGKAFNFTGVNHADVIISDEELRQRYMRQRNADHFGSIGPFEYASVLGAYCEEGKQWCEEVRDYIQMCIRDRPCSEPTPSAARRS